MQANQENQTSRQAISENLATLKNLDLSLLIASERFVDILDTNPKNAWKLGRIIENEGNVFKIRYDGWNASWDEKLPVNSKKLAPLRQYSVKYTGSRVRDADFPNFIESIKTCLTKMQNYKNQEFIGEDAYKITQFLRAELYITLDHLLAFSRNSVPVELMNEFLEKFIFFFVDFLDILPNYIMEFIEGKNSNQLLYLVNRKIAVVSSYVEMFDTFKKILGSDERTLKLIEGEYEKIYEPKCVKKSRSRSINNMCYFIDTFIKANGFLKITKLLQFSVDEVSEKDKNTIRLPFIFIKEIFSILNAMHSYILPAYKENIHKEIKKAFAARIESFSLRDTKEIEVKDLLNLVRVYQNITGESNPSPNNEASLDNEEFKLNILLKYIRSATLEKRLRAMDELKDIISSKESYGLFYPNQSRDWENDNKNYVVTNEKIKNIIIQNKLIDYILCDNFHVEVLKRSKPILSFLAKNKALSKNYLNILWKLSLDVNEHNKTAVFETIIEVSKYLEKENLDYLFAKINSIPLEKYDEVTIELFKEFVIQSGKSKSPEGFSLTNTFKKLWRETFNLSFSDILKLWELIQDKNKLDANLVKSAINALADILKKIGSKQDKEKVLSLCVDNLNNGTSVYQSLVLFTQICLSFKSDSIMSLVKDGTDDVILKWMKKHSLLEVILKDLDRYLNECHKITELKERKKEKIENRPSYVLTLNSSIINSFLKNFEGNYTHNESLDVRLSFISTLNLSKKTECSLNQFITLWNIFFKKNIKESDQSIFLNWIIKERNDKEGKLRNFIMPENLLIDFFETYFKSYSCYELNRNSEEFFKFYQILFEFVNSYRKFLDFNNKNFVRVLKFNFLIGIDFFWNILQFSSDDQNLFASKSYLINLHLRLNNENYKNEKRMEVWKIFIDRCIQIMSDKNITPKNLNYVSKSLRFFLLNVEGEIYLNSEIPAQTFSTISIYLASSEIKKLIKVPSNSLIKFLRKRIMEEFDIKTVDFDMYLFRNEKPITPEQEEDYSTIAIENARDRDYKENDIDISLQLRKNLPSRFFLFDSLKSYLSEKKSYSNLIFDLLSNADIQNDETIWDLIKTMPTNASLKDEIEKLSLNGSKENWNSFFNLSCKKKFLYILEIIEEIMNKEISLKNTSGWIKNFHNKNGFKHLSLIYKSNYSSSMENRFDLYLNDTLLRILLISIENKIYEEDLSEIVEKTLNNLCTSFAPIQNQDVKVSPGFINSAFELFDLSLNLNSNIKLYFLHEEKMASLFTNGLLEYKEEDIKSIFKEKLTKLQYISPPFFFKICCFIIFLNDNMEKYRDKCQQFFDLFSHIIISLSRSEIYDLLDDKNVEEFFDSLIKKFKQLKVYEKNHFDSDYLLQGILKILQLISEFDKKFQDKIFNDNDLLKLIVGDCLFDFPTNVVASSALEVTFPKCKNPESRKIAFRFLNFLISGEKSETKIKGIVFKTINDLILKAPWRSNLFSDWNITPLEAEKSRTGYLGLRNLGNTCYMNSLFQQFFMIDDFRENILQVSTLKDENGNNETVLYHFQLIMQALKSSQKAYYEAKGFCKVFKNMEGNPINVVEQMDVDEFFSNLLEKIENETKGTPYENLLKNTFGGLLSDELIGKQCSHYSEKEEAFFSISLQVKNQKNIENSLKTFIQGDLLEGPDAYFCEKCDKKVRTLKRQCIKRLPNMLILVLKRFEFNYETMSKIKLNDYYEFPLELDMTPYTQAYLKKKENSDDSSPESFQTPEYYQYKLRGVVIHVGTSDSGHYYSFIKDKNNFTNEKNKKNDKWFEFNDISIRDFNISDLENEAFGGEDKNMQDYYGKGFREKSNNAYLLFYERVKFFDENGRETRKMFLPNEQINISKIYQDIIRDDNYRYHVNKILVDQQFDNFISEILANPDSEELLILACKYFLIVRLRLQNRDKLPKFVELIKNAMEKNVKIAQWILKQFIYQESLKEFLVECPILDMKYVIFGIIRKALKCISDHESTLNFRDFKSESLIPEFLKNLLTFILFKPRSSSEIIYKILIDLSTLNQKSLDFLNELNFLTRAVEFTSEEKQEKDENELIMENFENCELKFESWAKAILKKQEKKIFDKITENSAIISAAMKFYLKNSKSNFFPFLEEFLNEGNLEKLFMKSKSKMARKILAQFLSKVIRQKKEKYDMIVKFIFDELDKLDESDLKVVWIVLEEIIKIPDEQEQKINDLIPKIFSFFDKNSEYYKCFEISLDYLFKIAGRNPTFLKSLSIYLIQNKERYNMLEIWIKDNVDLYYKFDSRKTFKFTKYKTSNISQYFYSINSDKHKRQMEKRIRKLDKLLYNNSNDLAPLVDSDEDFSERNWKKGDKLDYSHDKFYHSCEIVESMDEMFKIKSENSSFQRWIFYDDDKIGPYKTFKEYYEDYFDFYK